ncbi:MAG: hypothetical protein ABIY55_23615 [Kofleriaceae bacterium]
MRLAIFLSGVCAAGVAHADDDVTGTVIFARGSSLMQVDAHGKAETELAKLPAKVTVRALRSDAGGTVLLADLAGKWAWMSLDGQTKGLTELPCADGPAQLAEDGASVACRSPRAANQTIVVELAAKPTAVTPPSATATAPGAPGGVAGASSVAINVPPGTVRPIGTGIERRFVWADASGVWTAPAFDPKRKTRVAPDAPLRGFLPSPDGDHALGVYADQVFSDVHHTKPAEVLMTVQLDGQGARRKAIRDGVAVEWSHDAQWILIQDGASACIMRATGGQYKCWKGFTAASISSDGRWGLVLGNRDGSKKQVAAKPTKAAAKPAHPSEPDAKPWDKLDEPSNEPEAGEAQPATDDVSVAPPSGPLALYRVRLDGAFTDRPTLLVKVVDGAAVWVPASR